MDFLNDTTLSRFWSKVTISPSGCWEYDKGFIWDSGYACLWHEKKNWRANRFALWAFKGPPPRDKPLALHTCDNKACVNPNHLYWGDGKDNTRDLKDRHPDSGTFANYFQNGHKAFCGSRILTDTEVAYIKMFLLKEDIRGVTRKHLAECYGVGVAAIKAIANGYVWKDIEPFRFVGVDCDVPAYRLRH
ncbi:hypothetical protein [Mesorhizobium sp.]|uniref:hypothetical protein n=1 Tax=Mesorhizobium sp. TaxID=1871066 RepID=UPI000FE734E8|nr:hypothetical protein [Mesorhizobium sp.]RWE44204.1 MAG: hypothetical protein EOS80_19890 [Mesorhizobium sp.]